MSNSLAISAVTRTLRKLISRGVPELGDSNVTTKPLDKARQSNSEKDQINIFLYQTATNAAWRNMDMPRQVKPGETGFPPLALNLYYLLTAYGEGDDETLSNKWLGKAMSVLYDHPLLGSQEISDELTGSELESQIERVRITPQPLSLEEISKLWTAFQTQYRISAAYQVEVVLIESTRSNRTPLPVLTRGKDDSGINAQADLIPPFPTIEDIRFVDPANSELQSLQSRVSIEPGDTVMILGHDFAGVKGDKTLVSVTVTLESIRLQSPREIQVPSADRDDRQVRIQIPDDPQNLPAGFYMVSLSVAPNGKPEEVMQTNEWPLLVAPKITTDLSALNIQRSNIVGALGEATIDLTCKPDVRPEQRIALLLGTNEVRPEPPIVQPNTLKFIAKQISAATFRVRLRVDGIDSHILDFSDPKKPKFIDAMQVVVK